MVKNLNIDKIVDKIKDNYKVILVTGALTSILTIGLTKYFK
jgi:hypothetical protein